MRMNEDIENGNEKDGASRGKGGGIESDNARQCGLKIASTTISGMKGKKPGYSQLKPALCSAFNPYYSTVSTISPAAWASIQSYAYTGGHAVAAGGAPVLSAEDSLYPHSTNWRKKTNAGGHD
jgi:hypothetical protein